MGEHVIKLPDVGEGVAEAELVEWHVKVGDLVREDAVLAAVMTDKATVEIPSPVDGKVVWLGAEVGDIVAVGAPLVKLEVGRRARPTSAGAAPRRPAPRRPRPRPRRRRPGRPAAAAKAPRAEPAAPRLPARPARRGRRASGRSPRRRCGCAPARRASTCGRCPAPARPGASPTTTSTPSSRAAASPLPRRACGAAPTVEEIKVVGLRRRIAEKMALAKSRIPHITYVEEVDVTALEELRARLNAENAPTGRG